VKKEKVAGKQLGKGDLGIATGGGKGSRIKESWQENEKACRWIKPEESKIRGALKRITYNKGGSVEESDSGEKKAKAQHFMAKEALRSVSDIGGKPDDTKESTQKKGIVRIGGGSV